jgi:hypothetical protein
MYLYGISKSYTISGKFQGVQFSQIGHLCHFMGLISTDTCDRAVQSCLFRGFNCHSQHENHEKLDTSKFPTICSSETAPYYNN